MRACYAASLCFKIIKSARRDSNPRPQPWQGCTPPTEPLALITRIVFGTSLAERSITQFFTIVNNFLQFFISSTIYLICRNCIHISAKSHNKESTIYISALCDHSESFYVIGNLGEISSHKQTATYTYYLYMWQLSKENYH